MIKQFIILKEELMMR